MLSDERREVAARLRELAHDNRGMLGAVRMRHVMDEGTRILGTRGLPDCAHVLTRYADLIDPTCHMVDTDHEYEDSIRCDVCQMTFNRPWEPFRFCPYCGARVVDGGRA